MTTDARRAVSAIAEYCREMREAGKPPLFSDLEGVLFRALPDAPAEAEEPTSEMIEAAAAAIYAEDDVWSQAIPFDKLDQMDRTAYRRIAKAALCAARPASSRSGGA